MDVRMRKKIVAGLGIIAAMLALIFCETFPITAQSFWPPPIISTVDPSGACANGTFWVNITTPSLWYCGGSVWNDASGGGGGGTPGGSSGDMQWNTSGSFSGTAPNGSTITENGSGYIVVTPNGGSVSFPNNNTYLRGYSSAYLQYSFGNIYLVVGTGKNVLLYHPEIHDPIVTQYTCASSASPAACGNAPAGSFVIPAGSSSNVVDVALLSASSQIIVTEDSSLGTLLSVTCNTTYQQPMVTARSAGVSFTVSVSSNFTTNPGCYSYWFVN